MVSVVNVRHGAPRVVLESLQLIVSGQKPIMKTLAQPVRTPEAAKLAEYEALKRRIHNKLVDKLDLTKVGDLQGDVLRSEIRLVVEHLCDTEDTLLNRNERDRLIEEVLDETLGFGPLEFLLKDPAISDILINGPKNVFVERRGKLERTNVEFRDNKHLIQIIDRIVSKVGRRVDEVCERRSRAAAACRDCRRNARRGRSRPTGGRDASHQRIPAGRGLDTARRRTDPGLAG